MDLINEGVLGIGWAVVCFAAWWLVYRLFFAKRP